MLSTLPDRRRALGELDGPSELVLFARVGTVAATVPLLMRLPLPRLAAVLSRRPRRGTPSAAEIERIDRLVALAPRVARPLVRNGCLTRGVTLFWFLRRSGLEVELIFGIDPDGDGDTDGHCWLSLAGEPFLERVDPRPRVIVTYRVPAAQA